MIAAVPALREYFTSTSEKYYRGARLQEANAAGRLERWRLATQIWLESSPMFRIGLGEQAPVFVYSERSLNKRTAPHNSYLTVAVRGGLVALGLIVTTTLFFWITAIRRIRALIRRGSTQVGYAIALLLCHVATAVAALFNVVLGGPYSGIFHWLLIGLTVAAISLAEQESWRPSVVLAKA